MLKDYATACVQNFDSPCVQSSLECHVSVTKHKTPARSNFPLLNFENSGTIQFSSSSSTSKGLCVKNLEKRALLKDYASAWSDMILEIMTRVKRVSLFQILIITRVERFL